jgi:hypothetical protein
MGKCPKMRKELLKDLLGLNGQSEEKFSKKGPN